jgi:hypothetical protein
MNMNSPAIKIALCTLFLATASAFPVWARLGETEGQLIARYGKVINRDAYKVVGQSSVPELTFNKSGFRILVMLWRGISSEEFISKLAQNSVGRDPITEREANILLNANTQSHIWGKVPPNVQWPDDNGVMAGKDIIWKRDDGAMAYLASEEAEFGMKSRKFIDFEQDAYKAAHASSLEGF